MELRHLRYFLAVADASHFRRAAEALHISQPTLSQQIQQLEKELGTTLFDRIGRRVQLTAAGDTLRHHAQLVLQGLDDAQVALSDLDGLRRGKLFVGVVQTFNAYLIPPIITRFAVSHPGVFLSVEELTTSQIEQDVLRGRLNVGISYIAPHMDAVDSEPLFEDEFVLIVSARHRLARRKLLKMTELEDESLVMLPSTYCVRQVFDEKAREVGIRPKVAVEMNSIEGILATVRNCEGATILPVLTLPKRGAGLRAVKLMEPTLKRTVGLVWRRGCYRCRAMDAFLRYARGAVGEMRLNPS
jgi:LysR family cyn operon transcriptional activator